MFKIRWRKLQVHQQVLPTESLDDVLDILDRATLDRGCLAACRRFCQAAERAQPRRVICAASLGPAELKYASRVILEYTNGRNGVSYFRKLVKKKCLWNMAALTKVHRKTTVQMQKCCGCIFPSVASCIPTSRQ